MLRKEEVLLILYVVIVIFMLVAFVVIFFMAFQRRKNKLLLEQIEARQRFEKELTQSQLEIQEQTFKNIAWELHDNVGQLLSVVNIQLNLLHSNTPSEHHEEIERSKEIISTIVQEVRSLSKILNSDVIQQNGLIRSLEIEIERFNRMKFLDARLEVTGEQCSLSNEHEILLFRILQEFLSNVIKHAKANSLYVGLEFTEDALNIKAKDDGVGFDVEATTDSSGMLTMRGRAQLLKADYDLSSVKGEGTQLRLKYPLENES